MDYRILVFAMVYASVTSHKKISYTHYFFRVSSAWIRSSCWRI